MPAHMTFTIEALERALTQENDMTNTRIAALEAALMGGSIPAHQQDFAKSLIVQFANRGGLSDKQWYWVQKLAAPAPAKVALADSTAMTRIVEMFSKVAQHLQRPALLIMAEIEYDAPAPNSMNTHVDAHRAAIRLNVAGERSRFPGSINVTTDGRSGERDYLGRIHKDGAWEPRRGVGKGIERALSAFAADPVGVAAEYGKLTGVCCFCARKLTDKRSTDMGYGPICAQRWGLEWGRAAA